LNVVRNKALALSGLLTVLSLTMSGCQTAPDQNPVGAQAPSHTETVKTPASSVDPATVEPGENWINLLGNDPALATSAAVVGNKVLNLVFDQFPQNTVGGFKPTQADFDQAIAAYKPFTKADAIQQMESEWATKQDLPTLTSGRVDRDGNFSQTYVTEAGESCTDSDKPYDVKPVLNQLITIPDENQVELPSFYSHTEVTVHCKEGGLLQGQMQMWFPLVQENGTWLVSRAPQVKPGAPFKMVSQANGSAGS
jgi:hypothetical protein